MRKLRVSLAAVALVGLPLLFMCVPAAGAVTITVACPGQSLQVDGVDKACSGDIITVTGTCTEVVTIGLQVAAGCPGVGTPFDNLRIRGSKAKKGVPGTVLQGTTGPAITVNANATRVEIAGLTVGSNSDHAIAIASAHRVKLTNITTPSPGGTIDDGVNVDALSTRTQIISSTLNGNGGDGVEMGATNGKLLNVTANDNAGAGINVTGTNVDVQRCTAHDTAAGFTQTVGFLVSGSTNVIQRSNAQNNTVAQFHDTSTSRGVIHFRNTAGDPRAVAFAPSGKGFLEEGSGNYISNCTVLRNKEDGVHLAGAGNRLQRSSVSQNGGAQILVTGSRNFLDTVAATRLSTGPFASVTPTFNVVGSTANFFNRCSASVAGVVLGDGFTIPDATTTGVRNSRRPFLLGDPPASMR